jgi:hypothetical protein
MITVERCACGHPGCRDFWLAGIGKFVQGSGFSEADATRIARLLNGESLLNLKELLETQNALQVAMGHPTGHGESGLKENLLQAVVEVVEALRETNFKPWKTAKKPVDRQALATELTDILQFWANAALAMNLTPEELTQALRAKWLVNRERINTKEVISS